MHVYAFSGHKRCMHACMAASAVAQPGNACAAHRSSSSLLRLSARLDDVRRCAVWRVEVGLRRVAACSAYARDLCPSFPSPDQCPCAKLPAFACFELPMHSGLEATRPLRFGATASFRWHPLLCRCCYVIIATSTSNCRESDGFVPQLQHSCMSYKPSIRAVSNAVHAASRHPYST
eukprot:3091540-Pleurochrysis_carterae.AAC.2